MFRHFVRPDGTIRLVTTSPKVTPNGTDTVVELPEQYQPGLYLWDFSEKRMGEVPATVRAQQEKAFRDAAKAAEAQEHDDAVKLRGLLNSFTGSQRQAIEMILERIGWQV